MDLSVADSVELARVHDLRSAIRRISRGLELHRNLPNKGMQFRLAVAEAKLTTESDVATGKIIEVRKVSVEALVATQTGSSEREVLVKRLRVVQHEFGEWSRTYSRFLDDVATLRRNARAEIHHLRLPAEDRSAALIAVDGIILNALVRAAQA